MKSTFKTLQTQVLHLIRGAVIILISARGGAAQFMTQEQAHAQYGQMVREMQTEAAAILSDAPSYLDVSKSCPSAQVDTSQNDQSQGDLRIFVSFSMSEGTLKSLFSSLTKMKTGSLVMRGLYQNSFQKTAFKLKELGISVTIDPAAFERFHVTSVPQFVLSTGDASQSVDTRFIDTRVDTLRGNVSLDFALSQFADKGDTASIAKHLLLTLRKRP